MCYLILCHVYYVFFVVKHIIDVFPGTTNDVFMIFIHHKPVCCILADFMSRLGQFVSYFSMVGLLYAFDYS